MDPRVEPWVTPRYDFCLFRWRGAGRISSCSLCYSNSEDPSDWRNFCCMTGWWRGRSGLPESSSLYGEPCTCPEVPELSPEHNKLPFLELHARVCLQVGQIIMRNVNRNFTDNKVMDAAAVEETSRGLNWTELNGTSNKSLKRLSRKCCGQNTIPPVNSKHTIKSVMRTFLLQPQQEWGYMNLSRNKPKTQNIPPRQQGCDERWSTLWSWVVA